MKNKLKRKANSIISIILVAILLLSALPTFVTAAQVSEYVDPADAWLSASGRTSELDLNATVTYETFRCSLCERETLHMNYRVPEYTRTGETARNRGVRYSDGTLEGGNGTGNLDNGTPGVDSRYTGYHWTKSVCQVCGTFNTIEGRDIYNYGRNVYALYPCAQEFFLDFDSSECQPYNENYHRSILKKGEYCQFCKGTLAKASEHQELHTFKKTVDAQLGNHRFHVTDQCGDCGYTTAEYVGAKSVISAYYGTADGEAHTLTVSDLSDRAVKTSIRYGNTADTCNRTSAPNYTQPGYYTVYYEITYDYAGERMIENGVSYVWLLADNVQSGNNGASHTPCVHDYRYSETVPADCINMGFEHWQCDRCGRMEKRNYTPAVGHSYGEIVLHEATCKQGGVILHLCGKCGDFYQTNTVLGEHKYESKQHNPSCREVGYTEHTCHVCGNRYVTDITSLIAHAYERITKQPTCTEQGYTTATCTMCGLQLVDNYTEPIGHNWDEGWLVTNATCTSEGVLEFSCLQCGDTMIKSETATGHTPGAAADCTNPQICEVCKSVLKLPTGHNYMAEVTEPTCTTMGYTTYTCENCKNTYTGDYTEMTKHHYNQQITPPTCTEMGYTTYMCEECENAYTADYLNAVGHQPSDWIVDVPATIEQAGSKHIECMRCGETLQTMELTQLIDKDNSDEDGNAKVGAFSIILTNSANKPVFDSEITIDISNNITIKLPSGKLLDFADQTTITVFHTETQTPADGLHIFIYDSNDNAATGTTDDNGQLKVPNSQSNTGNNNGTIGGENAENTATYVVTVTDHENNTIGNCDIWIGEDNNIVVDLPNGVKPTREQPVIVMVADPHSAAQTGVTVIVLGDADYMEKGKTDIFGKVTLPITNAGYTDKKGQAQADKYIVSVSNQTAAIEHAFVKLETIQNEPDAEGNVSKQEHLSVVLPESVRIDYANRIKVTVLHQTDGTPVADLAVTVTEAKPKETSDTNTEEGLTVQPKSASGATDKNGVIIVPPQNEDITDDTGNGSVTDTKPNGNEDMQTSYIVTVSNADGVIANAYIRVTEDKITVKLPDTHTLNTDKQTTVMVTDKDGQPMSGVRVTVIDKDNKTASNSTDSAGKVVLPVKSSGGSSGGSRPSGGGGGRSYSSFPTINVKVMDKDGKNVSVTKSTDSKGNVTVTLPVGRVIDSDNYYTVTITDGKGLEKAETMVTLKDRKNGTATGITDKNGTLTLPATDHKAYIVGYPDGTFRPEGNMSRAEAAAIFARTIAEEKDERISGKSMFADVKSSEWYATYVAYLEKHNVITGYADGTFRPEESITRAEFATMTVRAYTLTGELNKGSYTANYTDLSKDNWAYANIAFAKHKGWLNGYADGSFCGDHAITRAEVVTVINRATSRIPDKDYINKHLSALNTFTDLKSNNIWYFYDILEAANTHEAAKHKNGESWVK